MVLATGVGWTHLLEEKDGAGSARREVESRWLGHIYTRDEK